MSVTETSETLSSTIIMDNDATSPNCREITLKPKNLFNNAKGTLEEIKTYRVNDLTPRKSLLYHASQRYRQRNSVLRQRSLTAKQRILKAERYMQTNIKSMGKLNTFTQQFIQSQIRMQPQKPRGRRFTTDDKVFALSLYKQSGKAYKVLSKMFALPSRKCILDLLKKIPFEAGINKRIFEHLKTDVQKIKHKLDRYCTVVFDEISLSTSLHYLEQYDKVIGFKDFGGLILQIKL